MAGQALQSATALTRRTVHLKLYPTPRTFVERREVLRILERYGEVVMFRSLKYHPVTPFHNSFFAIFATESATQDLLSQSPVRYTKKKRASSLNSMTTDAAASMTSDGVSDQTQDITDSEFQLEASTTTFSHEHFLTSPHTNPRHGPYKPSRHTAIGASLMKSIPKSIMSSGMLDWEVRKGSAEESLDRRNIQRTRELPRVMEGLKALSQSSVNQAVE